MSPRPAASSRSNNVPGDVGEEAGLGRIELIRDTDRVLLGQRHQHGVGGQLWTGSTPGGGARQLQQAP